jgi:hypothetical protein
VHQFLQNLLAVVRFDFTPLREMLGMQTQSGNSSFAQQLLGSNGYSVDFMDNMEPAVFVLGCIAVAWLFTKLCERRPAGVQTRRSSKEVQMANAATRFAYEFFLEFAICVLINLTYAT